MRISLSYTGKSGLYVSVTPVGMISVLSRLREFRIPNLYGISKLHATLLYSRDRAPALVVAQQLLTSGQGTRYPAKPIKFEYWEGHDKVGYLVLKLESKALVERHKEWAELGQHSFEYTPHMTIAKDLPLTPELKSTIEKLNSLTWPAIYFDNEKIEDIDESK